MLTAVAVAAVYGTALRLALRPLDHWLFEQRKDAGFTTAYRTGGGIKNILGLAHPKRASDRLQPGQRLGLLLGPSVLWDGIDPYQLTAEMDGPYRWANIPGSAFAEHYLLLTRLIYGNGLKPEVLIVVANPGVLVLNLDDDEARVWYDPRLLFKHLIHREFKFVPADALGISYIPFRLAFPYRQEISTLFERTLFRTQVRMFEAWGSGLESLFAPNPEPWRGGSAVDEPAAPVENAFILGGIKKLGWFEAANYRSDTLIFRSFAEIFRLAHANGTKTFIVLAPETSIYRAELPPGNAFHITHTLKDVLGEAAPVVLDFRSSFADDLFKNVNHLSPTGRVEMTARLAKVLKQYLSRP